MPEILTDGMVCGTKVLGHAMLGAIIITNQKCPVVISFPELRGERQKRLFFMKP
jgi:hypothetical protein